MVTHRGRAARPRVVPAPYASTVKRCADGRAWKPVEDFPRNRRMKDGRHSYWTACHNARGQETRQRPYGGSRHDHLTRRYGISAADVDAMIEAQGGRCPICGRSDPEQVDHDHVTGRVRGILCCSCNGGLGQLRGDEFHEQVLARAGRLRQAPG